jgi:predicted permease
MDTFLRDLRYATRALRRRPGFAVLALFSLALGIGANTAVFNLANAIVFRDSPLRDPEEVIWIYRKMPGFDAGPLSYPDFEEIRDATTNIFADVAGAGYTFTQVDRADRIESVMGEMVSGTYFTLQGLGAHIGRAFMAEDDVSPGGRFVVMLSYSYWQRAFGGSPDALGSTLRMNGHGYEIIGVVPRDYPGTLRGFSPAFYVPISMINQIQPGEGDRLQARDNQFFFARARLAPGVSVEQARITLAGLATDFRTAYPESWDEHNALVVTPATDVIINPMIDRIVLPAIVLAMVVVGMVLLIACANLASFLLAQATDRKKEVAIRLALGAKRGTLVRQLLTESLLLASIGGAAAVVLAVITVRLALSIELPFPIPIELDTGLDGRLLGFALAVSLLAGLLFGLAPALQATKPDVAPTLKDESTGGGRPRTFGLRNTLVVGQVAVSLLLLIGAGLFLRSLGAATSVNPGFGHEPTAVVSFQVSAERYTTPDEAREWTRSFVDRAAALPGVAAVGLTGNLHLNTMSFSSVDINVDGFDPPPGRQGHLIDRTQVDAGFFDAAGIPILQGRNFTDADRPDGRRVVIINRVMAERFWPGEDAVGRIIREGDGDELEIVGVAAAAKVRSLGEEPRPFIYYPYSQDYTSFVTVLARAAGNAEQTAVQLVALLRDMDPETIIFESKTMEEHLSVMLIPARLSAFLSTLFGGLALALAVIGLYGVVSYAVAQRRREIGIRMALGATRGSVVCLMIEGGMKLVAVGGAIGVGLALLTTRVLQGFLFGIAPLDPMAFLAVPVLLGGVALLAAYIPARGASRVDPVRALKAQ